MRHSAYKDRPPTYTTAGTPAELDILKLMAQYDLLSTDYIYNSVKYHTARVYLTRLSKGHYIGFPDMEPQETLAYIPRNNFYVFELKPRGKALCALNGIEIKTRGNDHFLHMLLRSKLEYLLDHGPLKVISPQDILSHEKCPKSTRQAPYPFRLPKLEPDITRGFTNGDAAFFVHVEVDRGTEQVDESSNQKQTLRGKVKRYAQYIHGREWEAHFGFSVPPSILFLTTRQNTTKLMDIIEEEAPGLYDRFYILSVPHKPLPTHNLFAPWQGVNGAFDLMEMLNGRAEKS